MDRKKTIGIVGCWYLPNYGSLLNGYATFITLKKLGYNVLNILTPKNNFTNLAKHFIASVYEDDEIVTGISFDNLNGLNAQCDIFLTGSDQLWRYNGEKSLPFNDYFKLSFVRDDKPKISYAVSFGAYDVSKIPVDIVLHNQQLLSRYKHISVREKAAVNICKNDYLVDARHTIEPVFLLTNDELSKIISLSNLPMETDKYLLVYLLDPTDQKFSIIETIARKFHLKVKIIFDAASNVAQKFEKFSTKFIFCRNVLCSDFLHYFKEASFVFTDSFHGGCFSIIFNKPFLAYTKTWRGSDRFDTLKDFVGERFFINSADDFRIESITLDVNYDESYKTIDSFKKDSINWLIKALQ